MQKRKFSTLAGCLSIGLAAAAFGLLSSAQAGPGDAGQDGSASARQVQQALLIPAPSGHQRTVPYTTIADQQTAGDANEPGGGSGGGGSGGSGGGGW